MNAPAGAQTRHEGFTNAAGIAVRLESIGAQSLRTRQSHVVHLARECWTAACSERLPAYL